jgi:hypothetical protein
MKGATDAAASGSKPQGHAESLKHVLGTERVANVLSERNVWATSARACDAMENTVGAIASVL